MLQIVAKNDSPVHRLALARRHVETAIAHINDEAQSRVPSDTGADASELDELRLIVRALADIREALRATAAGDRLAASIQDPSRADGFR